MWLQQMKLLLVTTYYYTMWWTVADFFFVIVGVFDLLHFPSCPRLGRNLDAKADYRCITQRNA